MRSRNCLCITESDAGRRERSCCGSELQLAIIETWRSLPPSQPESRSGLEFDETYARSLAMDLEGITVRVPSVQDLIRNKRAIGRTKDLADAEALEDIIKSEPGA